MFELNIKGRNLPRAAVFSARYLLQNRHPEWLVLTVVQLAGCAVGLQGVYHQ
jgi:hypothetical protein